MEEKKIMIGGQAVIEGVMMRGPELVEQREKCRFYLRHALAEGQSQLSGNQRGGAAGQGGFRAELL